MKNTLIVISMVLVWAAHGGTIHAQPRAQRDPALACAQACLEVLGPACQDTPRIVECVVQQRQCSHQALQTMSENDRVELLGRAVQHFTSRTECANPNARQRRQRAAPAPTPAPPATQPRPRPRQRQQTRQPTATARASTTREERLAAARALARTAVPTDRQPTRAEIDQLQERIDQIPELRAEIEALRAELALSNRNALERDHMLMEHILVYVRGLLRDDAQQRCRPGQEYVEFTFNNVTERVPCNSSRTVTTAIDEDEADQQPATSSDLPRVAAVRTHEPRVRHQRDSRIGLLTEISYWGSRYQLVAHDGSRSPKSVGFGLGLTVRLIRHQLYLIGAASIGIGIADGEHVPAQAHAHYRVGVLGIVAEHLMLGASAQFSHRYSGNGELREQNGTWYQLRHRGLRLDVGYIWRTAGWSPFISVSGVVGVGCHADRRLSDGEQCEFDPAVMLSIGAIHLEHRARRRR